MSHRSIAKNGLFAPLNRLLTSTGWRQLVNADVANAAAIAYSKLNLATSIVNADIAAAAAIAVTKLASITSGQVLMGSGAGNTSGMFPRKNLLVNGNHQVVQRGSNVTAVDNAYQCGDHWRSLFSTGSGGFVRSDNTSLTGPAGGSPYSDMIFSGGTGQKFGRFQVIESQDMWHARGQVVSLSFWALCGGSISDMRAAVLSWTGSPDSTTGHPVNPGGWNAAGTNPTLNSGAGWGYCVAPTNLGVTGAWVKYKIENISVPANATNLAVMYWSDDTTHTGGTDLIAVNSIQLEIGAVATDFERLTIQENLARCMRYYQKSFQQGVTPVQNGGLNGSLATRVMIAGGGGVSTISIRWPVIFHHAPTITLLNPGAANAQWRNVSNSSDCTAAGVNLVGDEGAEIYTGHTAAEALTHLIAVNYSAVAEI